jgi:hypothetical protein
VLLYTIVNLLLLSSAIEGAIKDQAHTARASCIDRETRRTQLSSSLEWYSTLPCTVVLAAWPEHKEQRR